MKLVSRGWRASLLALTPMALAGCGQNVLVLHPAGPAAREIERLIILSVILLLVVIVPVLALTTYIVWKYRDRPENRAPYAPQWTDSRTLEWIWWGIPVVIVGVLGAYTAKTTFALTRPPQSNSNVVTVDVVSLDWKWLFLYPDERVATVNYCVIPTGVPVQFVLTSDAPINSFWVPQLAGQEYTMPGMALRLWVQADAPGNYYGHGANFTGQGFADMSFTVQARPESAFQSWAQGLKEHAPALTAAGYQLLKKPGVTGRWSYGGFPEGLFDQVVWQDGGQYMSSMWGMPTMGSIYGQSGSNLASLGGGDGR
ncbi:cytochrome c oxidase subunit II [Alicyclobacillus vulcanalis]|uniref:Cytochrome c oxidase subunit 2 n=1 Tax=Alicyclobacillus vulcanalis TaxID=252246 RepID=A0A1N7K0N8_9BACL|nr:cytochrome c oxidase subunit II [Alicyclobacillus vulcanalis]SIS55111.1 cytochrome o ubiquinol oxidase subunit 2/cytochrome aa3-600 menaquinol oxidase subunit 2 [Alicyclobacillus vulcanalis]